MSRLLQSTCLLCALSACTSYTPTDVDRAVVIATIAEHPGGKFTLEQAGQLAMERNPDLRAALAAERAADAVVQPLMLEGEYRSGTEMLALMADPIALLGLGPRGGAQRVDRAKVVEAFAEVHVAHWRVLGELAELYAVDAALATLTVPSLEVDAAPFVAAGLAGSTQAASLEASQAAMVAERAALRRDREANRARLRELLALSPAAGAEFEHGSWDRQGYEADSRHQLDRHPELWAAETRFRLADAEFRAAVADQWPTVMIGPEFSLMGGGLEWMSTLKMPLLAHGMAAAARERRDVAHERLRATWLKLTAEAEMATLEETAMQAMAAANSQRAAASAAALRSATVAVEVDPDAFAMLTEAAAMAVEDARMLREAKLAEARATIRAGRAFGNPQIQFVR